MKKALKIILAVFILASVLVGGIAIWQWKNIQGIVIGVSEEAEEIEKRRSENQGKLVKDIETYMDEPVREMTEEEKKDVKEGKVEVTDVYQQIFEEKEQDIIAKKQENQSEKPEANVPSVTKDEIISRYMAQLYALQNEFTARAEATINQGAHYYDDRNAHPQDPVARAETIAHFTPIVRGIEKECDAKVEAVISNLKSELEAIGEDTSVIATVRQTYAREKQLKLSYYANKYLK